MTEETYDEMKKKIDEKVEFAQFDDGSVLTVPRVWLECFEQKTKDHNATLEGELAEFHEAINFYWKTHTELTKFGEEPGEEYATKSDLAKKVLYSHLRAYLMAHAFKILAAKNKTDSPGAAPHEVKVVVLDEKSKDGMREIKFDEHG